jgi:hypothetical protein
MIKKTTLLLLALGFLSFTGMAGQVGRKQARTAGVNFYYEMINRVSATPYQDLRVKDSFTVTADGLDVYYAFNFEGKGFVVVSAADNVVPVLAYSFEGSYGDGNRPPQFSSWMEGYAKQISYGVAHAIPAPPAVKAEWERLSTADPSQLTTDRSTTDVSPLLISTWDQGSPYNFLCPADGSGPGGHVWSGCVATAMSQVMYYWRWPDTGLGYHCYNPSGYPQQCADFTNTTYNWYQMINSLNYRDTAMAMLQWHAGISVNMMYSPSGSGAYSEDAVQALISNFKYHPNSVLLEKDNYGEAQWESILRENLDAKRPMYYDGYGSGGHAFNVDGYQGQDYFHFNWGWSGSFNGYFYLNNLNPGGNNFTWGQGAIVNLYPDTLSYTYPSYCTGQMVLTSLNGTFDDGSGPAKNYQDGAACSWLISPQNTTDSVGSITISFNRFSTEAGTDVLKIYQGSVADDIHLLATCSGDNIPPSVTVEGNQALVTFSTNGTVSKPGWYISYTSETIRWCNGTTEFTDPAGSFSDGSFNFNYQNSSVCRWRLIPEGSGPLVINFTTFSTEAGNDVVKIYDLGSQQLIGEFSGDYNPDDLPSATAPSGQAFVLFTTNSNVTKPGWNAVYSTYPVGVDETGAGARFTVYPNPASGMVTLSVQAPSATAGTLSVIHMDGTSVSEQHADLKKGMNRISLDISGLAPGVYILRLRSADLMKMAKLVVD